MLRSIDMGFDPLATDIIARGKVEIFDVTLSAVANFSIPAFSACKTNAAGALSPQALIQNQ